MEVTSPVLKPRHLRAIQTLVIEMQQPFVAQIVKVMNISIPQYVIPGFHAIYPPEAEAIISDLQLLSRQAVNSALISYAIGEGLSQDDVLEVCRSC
jgi:hypothetical protein